MVSMIVLFLSNVSKGAGKDAKVNSSLHVYAGDKAFVVPLFIMYGCQLLLPNNGDVP